MGKKKSGQPPPTEEDRRFKDLLRRIVAVPREEVEQKAKEYREAREAEQRKGRSG